MAISYLDVLARHSTGGNNISQDSTSTRLIPLTLKPGTTDYLSTHKVITAVRSAMVHVIKRIRLNITNRVLFM